MSVNFYSFDYSKSTLSVPPKCLPKLKNTNNVDLLINENSQITNGKCIEWKDRIVTNSTFILKEALAGACVGMASWAALKAANKAMFVALDVALAIGGQVGGMAALIPIAAFIPIAVIIEEIALRVLFELAAIVWVVLQNDNGLTPRLNAAVLLTTTLASIATLAITEGTLLTGAFATAGIAVASGIFYRNFVFE